MSKAPDDRKVVADNRKARHNYEIIDVLEAGIMLVGSEVKALRTGKATIAESYATNEGGEIWLINANIPEYNQANRENHEPKRRRKLLLKKREMAKITQAIQREGMTLIPLQIYFTPRGMAKMALAVAKGRKYHDKREEEKKKDWNRDKARLLRAKG
jgi:SsrA-binding protein